MRVIFQTQRNRFFFFGLVLVLAWLFSGFPQIRPAHAEAPCDEWWDDTYLKRKKITITAGTEQIPSGYSVSVTLDHADMVSEGSARADGDDVRVAYWNGTTWAELDRAVDPLSSWNDASTQIWFKSQATIIASSSDDNYYIYYDKPSASNPPDDWANIFMIGDDFNDGTLTSAMTTSTAGTASITETGGEAFIDLGTNEAADAGMLVYNKFIGERQEVYNSAHDETCERRRRQQP